MSRAVRPAAPVAGIAAEMAKVEDLLEQAIRSRLPLVDEAFRHSLRAGGKRLRPAMHILSAKACAGTVPPRAVPVAAALEAIHMASLMHDDVVDHSALRRGEASLNRRFSSEVSILVADYVYTTALSLLCQMLPAQAVQSISAAVARTCEGELQQYLHRGSVSLGEEEYLSIIENKTGILMSVCCQTGAWVAEAEEPLADALARFGLQSGVAFQLADDALDLIGDPVRLGKQPGTDLREGKVTLPLLHARRTWDGRADDLVTAVFGQREAPAEAVGTMVQNIVAAGGVAYTLDVAQRYVREAKRELSVLPPSAARDDLETLADYLANRTE